MQIYLQEDGILGRNRYKKKSQPTFMCGNVDMWKKKHGTKESVADGTKFIQAKYESE